jgi:hypothetical protein
MKEFTKKSNYDRHLNGKKQCRIVAPKDPPSSTLVPHKSTQIENVYEDKNKCKYCNRIFSRSDALKRHVDNNCRVKKDYEQKMEDLMERMIKMEEKMKELQEENQKYKQIVGNTTTIGTQNNIQINQIIVPYGNENLEKITVSEYKKLMIRGMNSVPEFVKYIHFNKDKPEYHNIYISNIRDSHALIYDGKDWQLRDRDETIEQLYNDKADILEMKFEEMLDKLDDQTIKMFKKFLQIKDTDNEVVKKIKKELKVILYNNRKLIKNC